jgi:hypothetical protein
VICPRCREAADRRAPRGEHCTDPGCTCGRQVERSGTATRGEAIRAIAALAVPIRMLADGEDPFSAPPMIPAALIRAFEQATPHADATTKD